MKKSSAMSVKTLALGAMMTALVILFQLLATYTAIFGPFATAMALIPIVIGAVLCGKSVGTWLGLIFALIVLFFPNGGTAVFLSVNPVGTIITVSLKGIACGFSAGLIYELLKKHNKSIAVTAASVVCPIVNTGLFLIGCWIFFLPHAEAIAIEFEMTEQGFSLFIAVALANFLFELLANLVLSPIITRTIQIKSKIGK